MGIEFGFASGAPASEEPVKKHKFYSLQALFIPVPLLVPFQYMSSLVMFAVHGSRDSSGVALGARSRGR